MLDAMSPEQFDERLAHHRLAPWGDDWQQTALVAATVHNLGMVILASHGADIDESSFLDVEDFMPGAERKEKPSSRRLTWEESERLDRERYGQGR